MMTDDELMAMVKDSIAPSVEGAPSRDLWTLIVADGRTVKIALWFDVAAAAVVAATLAMSPSWLWLLAYHL